MVEQEAPKSTFSLDTKNLLAILSVLAPILIKYGWPIVEGWIASLQKEEITLEDIQKLHDRVPTPEEIQAKIDNA